MTLKIKVLKWLENTILEKIFAKQTYRMYNLSVDSMLGKLCSGATDENVMQPKSYN